MTVLQEIFLGWRQIVSRIKYFHSKAVTEATQNFPTGPISTFLLTWPDPSPPQTRMFGAVGSTRPQHCSKANCATADKVNGVRLVGNIAARKNFAPPHFFGAQETFSNFPGAPIKRLSRIRAGRVFSANQNKKSKRKLAVLQAPHSA